MDCAGDLELGVGEWEIGECENQRLGNWRMKEGGR